MFFTNKFSAFRGKVVGRGNETQLEVGEQCNLIPKLCQRVNNYSKSHVNVNKMFNFHQNNQ